MYVVPLIGGSWGSLTINANFIALAILVYPACIAFAIAKHNLFDVDVYIKRAVGYVVMTTIVGMAYLSIQTLASTAMFPLFGDSIERVYPIRHDDDVIFHRSSGEEGFRRASPARRQSPVRGTEHDGCGSGRGRRPYRRLSQDLPGHAARARPDRA